jgi:hypothetical protein
MIANEIRSKRIQAGIPGYVLCLKARIARTRLSDIERSYAVPSRQELAKIEAALMDLIRAKHRMKAVAAEFGWPCEVK